MVFDLSATNNLPRSSTSSCTNNFFDGYHSNDLNKCDNQYEKCQCRPCCINSMINDHTYTLLKKICRKVIRDYQRQQSREKYTIFDGGNSINVRIHRSSFVPIDDVKCRSVSGDPSSYTLREHKQKDRKKNESLIDRNETVRRRKKYRAGYDDNFAESKQIDGSKYRGKNGAYESHEGRDTRKKVRDRENVNGKLNKDHTNGVGRGKPDRGTKVKGVRDGRELDVQSDLSRKKNAKGMKSEYGEDQKKKAASKKNSSEIEKSSRKDKQRKGSEDDGREHIDIKLHKDNKYKGGEDDVRGNASKSLNKILETSTRERSKKDNSGNAEERLNRGFRNDRYPRSKERDSATKSNPDQNFKGHKEGRDNLIKNRRGIDNTIGKSNSTTRKNKDLVNLPVISDLRARVRRSHDVFPAQSRRKEITGSSVSNGGREKYKDSKLMQLSKPNKDRINKQQGSRGNRRGLRTPRHLGIRFVRLREYQTTVRSRCDEVRPCDILRAHMEQRELCEMQRCYCLPCPCDCSAVYCQTPSTICAHLY